MSEEEGGEYEQIYEQQFRKNGKPRQRRRYCKIVPGDYWYENVVKYVGYERVGSFCRIACDECPYIGCNVWLRHYSFKGRVNTWETRDWKGGYFCQSCHMKYWWIQRRLYEQYENRLIINRIKKEISNGYKNNGAVAGVPSGPAGRDQEWSCGRGQGQQHHQDGSTGQRELLLGDQNCPGE